MVRIKSPLFLMYVMSFQAAFWSGQRWTDFEENHIIKNLISGDKRFEGILVFGLLFDLYLSLS